MWERLLLPLQRKNQEKKCFNQQSKQHKIGVQNMDFMRV